MDKIIDLLGKVLDKFLSARFLITVGVGCTYCHIIWHAVHFYLECMKASPDRMEAFATGLMMGFTGTATFIFKAYFDRADRADESKTVTSAIISTTKPEEKTQ